VARMAIDRGVNYIDTSPDYSATGSEQAVGRAIQGKRDQLFLATKFCTPIGHLGAGSPVAKYKEAVEASLGRLGTDYVDLCHIHSCDSVERLMDENAHEAFDQLKAEGKVRFLGFSSHTPNLVEVANAAVDSGRFDVMMLAYHHGIWAPIPGIIARARSEQDMGVVAMKTLKGAKHQGLADFRDEADVPLRVGQGRGARGRCSAGQVRPADPRELLLPPLRCVSRLLFRGAPRARRAPAPDVLRGLRLGEGGDALVLAASEERRSVRVL